MKGDHVMAGLVNMNVYEDYISISFDVGTPEIMSLGEKMNEICDQAYMNGYNWDAFLNSYIEENKPELLVTTAVWRRKKEQAERMKAEEPRPKKQEAVQLSLF